MEMEARIAALERRVRRGRAALLGLGLVLVAVLATGQGAAVPDVLRARQFEVVGPQGDTLAELNAWDDEHGGLALLNAEGHAFVVAMPSVTENGGAVLVLNDAGEAVGTIYADARGNGALRICHGTRNECHLIEFTE